jgi:hypothetical protein
MIDYPPIAKLTIAQKRWSSSWPYKVDQKDAGAFFTMGCCTLDTRGWRSPAVRLARRLIIDLSPFSPATAIHRAA